jgi:hypothetical protein
MEEKEREEEERKKRERETIRQEEEIDSTEVGKRDRGEKKIELKGR